MNSVAETALRASIQHWRENAEITDLQDVNLGPQHCALCREFSAYFTSRVPEHNHCTGCPVFQRTGQTGCDGSPYELVDSIMEDWENADCVDDPELLDHFRTTALNEVAFLESLLP